MKRLFVLFIMGLWIPSSHAESLLLTFDDLPRWVASGNGNVLAGQAFVQGAQSQTGHLHRSFLPKIYASGGGELEKTGTFNTTVEPYGDIETRINVFRGGRDRLEEQILETEVDLVEVRKDKTYLRELARARLLYADGLYYQEMIRALPHIATQTRSQLAMVQKQISAGLAPESDRLGFEIFLNRINADALLQQEDYEHAVREIQAILGVSSDVQVQLTLGPEQNSEQELLKASLNVEDNQDILILKKQSEISLLKQQEENKWWTPAIDVYGGYALYTFRQFQEVSINERKAAFGGVKLSFPIFDGLEARTRKRLLQHQERGYALEQDQKRRELEALLEKLKHELKNRSKLMTLVSRNIHLGGNYLRMASDEYRRGVKTGPELLEGLKRYWEDRRHLAEIQREYLQIKAELMPLLGR